MTNRGLLTMAFKNSFRLWDDELKLKFWTPEEIAESKAKAARIGEIIDAEQQGFITHDEAMIRHLIEDPDLAEIMLDDAEADEDFNKINQVKYWINEAKARSLEPVVMA